VYNLDTVEAVITHTTSWTSRPGVMGYDRVWAVVTKGSRIVIYCEVSIIVLKEYV
jgi:hypothetical protein